MLADLWAFSADINSWTELEQVGDKPGKRTGHIMVTRKESRDVILGFGWDGGNKNDVYKLTIDNNVATWTKMRVSGACPSERYDLSASVTSTEEIIIHGGFPHNSECWKAKITANNIMWTKLESAGEIRWGHSSETIGSHVIFIGGLGCKSTLA